MKEAYGGDGDWSLADWLLNEHPTLRIWKRIAKWSHGLQYTTSNCICRYMENLSELVHLIITNHLKGAFCPQDDKAVSANDLLQAIATGMGKKYRSSQVMGFFVRLISFMPIVKKAYGGIAYDKSLSDIEKMNYVVIPFEEGIKRTVMQ